jgi:hypothetical protein
VSGARDGEANVAEGICRFPADRAFFDNLHPKTADLGSKRTDMTGLNVYESTILNSNVETYKYKEGKYV